MDSSRKGHQTALQKGTGQRVATLHQSTGILAKGVASGAVRKAPRAGSGNLGGCRSGPTTRSAPCGGFGSYADTTLQNKRKSKAGAGVLQAMLSNQQQQHEPAGDDGVEGQDDASPPWMMVTAATSLLPRATIPDDGPWHGVNDDGEADLTTHHHHASPHDLFINQDQQQAGCAGTAPLELDSDQWMGMHSGAQQVLETADRTLVSAMEVTALTRKLTTLLAAGSIESGRNAV